MTWVSIAFATAAALVMGVAIQRGATCTVAAVEEITTHRSAKRLMALIEAALWVNAGLVIAQNRHWISELPAGYSITWWTLPGAVLLGLGAWVNKACAFGSIARLGSGELAYLATPLGFYLGCLSADTAFGNLQMTAQHNQQAIHLQFNIFLWPLLVLMLWRVCRIFYARYQNKNKSSICKITFAALLSPHGATLVIGFMFLATAVLAESWAYTDVLAQMSQGNYSNIQSAAVMSAALFAGAIIGGCLSGRISFGPLSPGLLTRCLCGGVLMAWGSLLIPGGNDGLILIGMPLLWPYAWLSFLVMCLTVALPKFIKSSPQ